MATTTGGTTYVTSTDLVADYPTASLALANRVDVVASGGPGLVKTAGYTITVADILGGNKFLYNSASPGTFTLPTSSLVDGMVVNVAQIGAGALTVSGGTIVGTTVTTAQYQGLSFVYVASGTTWYSVAPNATAPGMTLVTPTSIANSGGSASVSGGAVTLTGVTSISLNGVFTSTYQSYVIVSSIVCGSNALVYMRLRASGTDNTSSNYMWWSVYGPTSGSTALVAASGGGLTTSAAVLDAQSGGQGISTLRIMNPQTSERSSWELDQVSLNAAAGLAYWEKYAGAISVTTSYDGFTLTPASSNITGTIRVYGLKN